MNKKVLSITILAIALLISGCGKREENAVPTVSEEMETLVNIPTEVVIEGPGFGLMPEADDSQEDSADNSTEGLDPTEESTNEVTEPETSPSEAPTEPPETKPTEPDTGTDKKYCCDYSAYMSKSPAEQEAYMKTFSSPMDFVVWCQNAEAVHNAHNSSIEVEGGNINIGDYMD